jgi:hypothetical protein
LKETLLGLFVLSSPLLSEKIKLEMYRTIIFPVLSGYETWSVTLREEYRLNMFYNMVLRKVCGPESDEVTGDWRRLHNGELMICIAHRI